MRYCCTQCGATNIRMKKRREGKLGCAIATIFLVICMAVVVLFFFGGIFFVWIPQVGALFVLGVVMTALFPYILYRLFSRATIVCRECKGENCLVPMNSPRGEEILNGGVAPKPVMKKKIIIKKRVVNLNRDR